MPEAGRLFCQTLYPKPLGFRVTLNPEAEILRGFGFRVWAECQTKSPPVRFYVGG